MTQKEIWDSWKAPDTLEECVKLFFEILDQKEYSGMSDREFHPTRMDFKELSIVSCRVWDSHRLERVFKKMKELTCTSPTHTTVVK